MSDKAETAVSLRQCHPSVRLVVSRIFQTAILETQCQQVVAIDGRAHRQAGLGLLADISDFEALSIDFRMGHMSENETAEVVVLHPSGYLHLFLRDEGYEQLSAEALAQQVDAIVENEHARRVCQHDETMPGCSAC